MVHARSEKPIFWNGFGAEHFESVVYLNMEIEGAVREFLGRELSPRKIIPLLEVAKKQRIFPEKTLIFFDEIQACEGALASLKYFCEKLPNIM